MKINENQKVIPMSFDPKGLVDGVEIYIQLGEYHRPWNDPDKGSVTNVGTWNSSYTAIHGADPTGSPSKWIDLSDEQAHAFAAMAKAMNKRYVQISKSLDPNYPNSLDIHLSGELS